MQFPFAQSIKGHFSLVFMAHGPCNSISHEFPLKCQTMEVQKIDLKKGSK
jgi:hypothetical protein